MGGTGGTNEVMCTFLMLHGMEQFCEEEVPIEDILYTGCNE